LMDAAGMEIILLETVGIGQSDVEVMKVAHMVVVVLMPGVGDDVQVSKAGLMEIGDAYVVNKSDLPGADSLVVNLLAMARTLKRGSPSVLKVSAANGQGLERLFDAIEICHKKFRTDGDEMRMSSIRGMITEIARGRLLDGFSKKSLPKIDRLARRVLEGEMTVNEAAAKLSR
jgi:LAO/AO transport system kinase